MSIIWDEKKNEKLKRERHISFEEVSVLILEKQYVAIVEHPKRMKLKIFLIPIQGYIHAVPFVIDRHQNIVLKTIFPSRTFHKKYGGEKA